MTDRELMQQTLEALNAVRLSGDVVVVVTPEKSIYIDPLRRALRERLAQPDHDWEAEYTKQVELHNQTLDELRDALAQPEQEPVVKWDASAPNWHFAGKSARPRWNGIGQ